MSNKLLGGEKDLRIHSSDIKSRCSMRIGSIFNRMNMRYYLFLPLLLVLAFACAPDESANTNSDADMENNYPNLVQLNSAEADSTAPSKVYVDSVEVINVENEKALLISGNFANSCTFLQSVSHSVKSDTLAVSLIARMPADKLCAAVLTPFSFIYDDLPAKLIQNSQYVAINGKQFQIND